jgi:uncharacterized membrane protein
MPHPAPETQIRPAPLDPFPAPPPSSRPYPRAVVGLVLALAALIMGLWWLGTPGGLAGKAGAVGYAICHQIAERSFAVGGQPLPLCARCTGIYLGVMVSAGVLLAGGRARASQFAPRRVVLLLGLFVVLVGLDGVNSFLHLFPGYEGPYEPANWLRLVSGSLAGITMFTILLPAFNASVWARPALCPVLGGIGELTGLVLVIGIVDGLVLLRSPFVLTAFGLLSALGPVLILIMVWTILFMSVTRRENSARTLADLRLPLVAGLALAFLMLGAITVVRFALTGTWEGFSQSQFG